MVGLNTAGKIAHVKAILPVPATHSYWFGITGAERDGEWLLVDGSYPDTTDWRGGEPNGDGNCVELEKGSSYQWNDISCTSSDQRYVCELPGK